MKKIKHLSTKLLLLVIFLSIADSLLVWSLKWFGISLDKGFFGFGMWALFYILVNVFMVARIRKLTQAVKEIAKGNYDIRLDVKGTDELSTLGESINSMAAELEANTRFSRDFTRYVTHEFKTPLAVIRNYAEAAQLCSDPETVQTYLETIIESADRLSGMSKAVLELCKLDSTTLIQKKDRVCPALQIRELLLSLQFEWGAKQLTIVPELAEFEIQSNAELLLRIWQNLIGNAIKYTPENGSIFVTLQAEGDSWECTVRDSGIGIPREQLPQIFTPFYTGNASRSGRDNGLGLPLVKKITEKLGGSIYCESEEGKGTAFTIRIPF